MKTAICRKIALLAAVLMFAFAGASAQVNTARISGQVTDSSGAAVPDAHLTLHDVATGVTRTLTTDNAGQFTFTFVAVGTYTLTASHPGFRDEVAPQFELTAGQEFNLPLALKVENAQTTVTVNSETEALQTTSSSQNTTISSQQLNSAPVQHQDWTNTLQYNSATFKSIAAGTNSTAGQQGSGININGLPSAGYNVTVDGTNATSNPEFEAYNFYQGPNIINTVSNDAIAEISLVKGIAPATVSNTLSGNINIITKSGSNQFHGSLYENSEVALYDARNQFLKSRPGKTFNQFGGAIGGRILPNKLFFFGDYEGARLYTKQAVSGTVPSPYLESISPAVYAPLFAFFPSIPQPSNPTALTGVYEGSGTERQLDGSGLARLDYDLNQSNQIAVRYIRARPQLLIPQVIADNSETYSGHTDAVNANYLHIGRSWTEDTRFGFNQLKLTRIMKGYYEQLPALSFGFSSEGSNQFLQHGNYTTVEEGIAIIHGKQSIQFGGIYQHQFASRYKLVTPSIGYSTLAQFQANTPSSVLLTLYALPQGQQPFGFFDDQYGGYFQDDYRIASNLTLNLGLRYDYFTVPRESQGRFFNRGIDPTNPSVGLGFGPYRSANSVYNADHSGVQPRIGFAWNPFMQRETTVVHAGFGVLKEDHNFYQGIVSVIAPSATLPFQIGLNQSQLATSGLRYPINPALYPQQISQLQGEGVLQSNLPNDVINPYNPNPYSIQRYLDIDQGFPSRIVLSVSYVGTEGVQLEQYLAENLPNRLTGVSPVPNFGEFFEFTVGDHSNYNALQTTITKTSSKGLYLSASYTWGKVLSYGDADLLQQLEPQNNNDLKAEYGPAPYDIKNRFVANGRWELPLNSWTHTGSQASRLLLGGWQVAGVFTGQTGLPLNVSDSASSYPADRPDIVPNVSQYLGGYRTFPGSHQYLNPAAFAAVPLSTLSGAQIRGGDLGRYALRAPGVEDLDVSLIKSFAISERFHFQLRGDAFNSLNHTNFSGIVTTVNTSTFGEATSATARTMQIAGRLTF